MTDAFQFASTGEWGKHKKPNCIIYPTIQYDSSLSAIGNKLH